MKDTARAVVIGGGVVGASVLYHLAKIGWRDVLLLEKSELTAGSTWHAAGGMHTFNGEANISKLQKYTIDLYREISLEEAKRLNPLIDTRFFIGALWRADGGHCDPSGTTHAYVKAARQLGAAVERFTRVSALAQRRDGTWDVITDKGTVHAEHVVNCAGLWAREVGHMVGIELPVLAMEHHYLVTEDLPELKEREREIVNTTDYAGEIYMRQERAGALIGTYEPNGVVWSPVRTPDEFSMQLLPEDFERLAPYFEVGFQHFPALGRVGIKKAINGPFTFAPDGNPLVGPVRGRRNFWVACAVMAGFSQGGGIGLVLSRWMAEGDPGQDILSMDVARFGAFATPKYTSIKVPENYSRRFRLAYPNEELPAARPVRRSPIYDRLKSAGAVMGANFGLEHALWFAPPGVPPIETPSYRRSEAFPFVGEECRAVRSAVGIYETTNYGKYEVTGRGARGWLDRVFASRIPPPGRLRLAPMLNQAGRIVGDFSIACLAEDRFLVIGSGFAEEFHLRWFFSREPPPDVFVRSVASTLMGFSVAGPSSRELLQRLVRVDLSPQAFKLFHLAQTAAGFAPAILTRSGFTGELGYEIWTSPDYLASLYDELLEAGSGLGLVHFGGRALSSLRLEKGYGSFNKDFRPDYTPAETGLDRYVDFDKTDFTGRAAALAERSAGPKRRFVILEIPDAETEAIGYESILKDGAAVGYVTSAAFGHCIGRSLAAGYVPAALAREGEPFQIDIFGELRAAIVRLEPLYDPEGVRLRS